MLTNKEIIDKIKLYKERLAIKVHNYNQFTEAISLFRKALHKIHWGCDSFESLEVINSYMGLTNDGIKYHDCNVYPMILYLSKMRNKIKITTQNKIRYRKDDDDYDIDMENVLSLKLLDLNTKEYIPLICDTIKSRYCDVFGNSLGEQYSHITYIDDNRETKYLNKYETFNFMYYDEYFNKIITNKIKIDKEDRDKCPKGASYKVEYKSKDEYGETDEYIFVDFNLINNEKCTLSYKSFLWASSNVYFCVYTNDEEYDKYKELLTQRLKKDKLDALEEEINKLKENYKDIESKLFKL